MYSQQRHFLVSFLLLISSFWFTKYNTALRNSLHLNFERDCHYYEFGGLLLPPCQGLAKPRRSARYYKESYKLYKCLTPAVH